MLMTTVSSREVCNAERCSLSGSLLDRISVAQNHTPMTDKKRSSRRAFVGVPHRRESSGLCTSLHGSLAAAEDAGEAGIELNGTMDRRDAVASGALPIRLMVMDRERIILLRCAPRTAGELGWARQPGRRNLAKDASSQPSHPWLTLSSTSLRGRGRLNKRLARP